MNINKYLHTAWIAQTKPTVKLHIFSQVILPSSTFCFSPSPIQFPVSFSSSSLCFSSISSPRCIFHYAPVTLLYASVHGFNLLLPFSTSHLLFHPVHPISFSPSCLPTSGGVLLSCKLQKPKISTWALTSWQRLLQHFTHDKSWTLITVLESLGTESEISWSLTILFIQLIFQWSDSCLALIRTMRRCICRDHETQWSQGTWTYFWHCFHCWIVLMTHVDYSDRNTTLTSVSS